MSSAAVWQQAKSHQSAPSAENALETDDGSIIVTGSALTERQRAEKEARAITQDVTFENPVARFFDPVCFAVSGLPLPFLKAIGHRLTHDAEEAGLGLADGKCKPNILIFFVDDGVADIADMRQHQPWLFSGLQPYDIRKILSETGPVKAWSISELRNSDGLPLRYVRESSYIVLHSRRDLLLSVVLIDRRAAVGLTPIQLADYAAMRSLALIRPDRRTEGNTILTLFDKDDPEPPAELTRFDRGYLAGLNSGEGNLRSTAKMRQIARAVVSQPQPQPQPQPGSEQSDTEGSASVP